MSEDKDTARLLTEIHRMVGELREDFLFLKKHRNVLYGTPVLEFDEVCSLLRAGARTVQRLRETGQLTGFTFGRRRLYSLREVQAFIARMEQGTLTVTNEATNPEEDGRE